MRLEKPSANSRSLAELLKVLTLSRSLRTASLRTANLRALSREKNRGICLTVKTPLYNEDLDTAPAVTAVRAGADIRGMQALCTQAPERTQGETL